MNRPGWLPGLVAGLLLAGCAAPRVAPSANRLDEGPLDRAVAQSRIAPLTVERVVARSRAGEAPGSLIDDIRSSNTHLALTPEMRATLRGQGVAEAVLDELAAAHVLSLLRQMRGGELNDSRFGHRMRGDGVFAQLYRQRPQRCCERLGLNRMRRELNTARFRPPARDAGQLALF